jgi:IPT/TIG domain-containing protein
MGQIRRAVGTFVAGCVLALAGSSCGSYSAPGMNRMGNGGAMIADLVPASATAGMAAFMLTVNGSGFGTDAVVYWNGSAQTTTYISGNQVMAAISAAEVASKGTVPVYVLTGGHASNTMNFMVN